ncbi:MAG TPA: LmeA family phospholipid-binding protein [Anaerolineaceae bacterium]|nr:LmeA family phospholipid-binding protein [Anaerolineaceae bacterium]
MKTTKSATINLTTIVILVGLFVLLTSAACGFSGITSKIGNNLDFQVTLTEDQINTMLSNAHDSSVDRDRDLLDKVAKVDLHDGLIRVYGTRTHQGQQVSGSYDVKLAAVDGELKAEIVGVDIPGMSLDDPRVQSTNEEVAKSLRQSAVENRDHVTFDSVKVTNDNVQINLTVKLENK